MFGGKTSRMLASLERAKYRKKKIVLFKPTADDRYAASKVRTHGGSSWPAIQVSTGAELLELAGEYEVVALDEAFMVPGSAAAMIELFRQGKNVYVSSIQLSSNAEPFEEVMRMMPWATRVEVCPAVCPVSGTDAYYTIAKVEGLDEVHVGGAEVYEPRAFEHSNVPK